MKKKDYFLFITLFLSILGIYLICIMNIDLFITNYDNKIINRTNNFNAKDQYSNIIQPLLNEEITLSTMDETNKIISSDYLISMLSYFFEVPKEKMETYLIKLTLQKMINTIHSKYYDTEVIYITSESYTIIFTIDGKNIYYNKYLSGETCPKNAEESHNSIDIISTNVNNIMNKMGITSNIGFDITSIRKAYTSEYYELYGSVYFIEDKTHDIKITYHLNCDNLYILQLGFGQIDGY